MFLPCVTNGLSSSWACQSLMTWPHFVNLAYLWCPSGIFVMFRNLIMLEFPFWLSFSIFLRIIGTSLCDYLCMLKKIYFDKIWSLDLINHVYTVICNEKLTKIPLKGCLDVVDDLCYRPCLWLFLFDVPLIWPKQLSETLTKDYSMVESQIHNWLSHYE